MSACIIRWHEKQPDGTWVEDWIGFGSVSRAAEFEESLRTRNTVVLKTFPPYTEKQLMYFGGLATLDDILQERKAQDALAICP